MTTRPVSKEIAPIQYKLVKTNVSAIQKRVILSAEGSNVVPDQTITAKNYAAFRPELAAIFSSPSGGGGVGSPVSSAPIVGDPLMALQRVRQAQSKEHENAIKNQVEVQTKAVEEMSKLRRCIEDFEAMKAKDNDILPSELQTLAEDMERAGIVDAKQMMEGIIGDKGSWDKWRPPGANEDHYFIRVKPPEGYDKNKADLGGMLLKRIETKLNNAMDNIKDQQRLNDHKSSTLAKQFTNAEESALNLQNMGHKLLDIVTSKTFQP